jgi:hypothetical protein
MALGICPASTTFSMIAAYAGSREAQRKLRCRGICCARHRIRWLLRGVGVTFLFDVVAALPVWICSRRLVREVTPGSVCIRGPAMLAANFMGFSRGSRTSRLRTVLAQYSTTNATGNGRPAVTSRASDPQRDRILANVGWCQFVPSTTFATISAKTGLMDRGNIRPVRSLRGAAVTSVEYRGLTLRSAIAELITCAGATELSASRPRRLESQSRAPC